MIQINPQLRRAFVAAANESRQINRNYIEGVTLTLGILLGNDSPASQILNTHGVRTHNLRTMAAGLPHPGPLFEFKLPEVQALMPKTVGDAVAKASAISEEYDAQSIGPEAMLLGLLIVDEKLGEILTRCGVQDLDAVASDLTHTLAGNEPEGPAHKDDDTKSGDDEDALAEQTVEGKDKEGRGQANGGGFLSKLRQFGKAKDAQAGKPKSKTPTLDKFTTDLTAKAKKKELTPVIGRKVEIQRSIQILCRKTKNNPVLIGEAGVGKTAVAEAIAQRIADGKVPKRLKGKRVLALDMSSLVAGSRLRGEFEERLVNIIKEVKLVKNVILFVDEVHTIIGAGSAGGSLDASNVLKPALARGEIATIGATTLAEYRKYIENQDAALTRRFRPVLLEPPTVEETIDILKGLRETYEKHHGVKITDEAIIAAAQLSDRYVSDRFQPDKSIDLIDEASAKLVTEDEDKATPENPLVLTAEHVAQMLSANTGIPVTRLTEEESERLLRMETHIHGRLIGQLAAVGTVSRAIRRSRAGLKDPKRPLGAFLFLGPTGVGKTELARSLQEFLTGKEDDMIRLDMSEYMEKHAVATMIGAPPGYVGYEEGGKLTEAVRRRPYAVVLFDEIEKAHPDVFNLLLQILEDGRLTDRQGRTVDFRNTIIILTSNIAAHRLMSDDPDQEEKVMREVNATFKPEFINRLDDVVTFHQLSRDEVGEIRDLLAGKIRIRLLAKQANFELDDSAKEFLLTKGYDKKFGARPMRRALQKYLEDPLSEEILRGTAKPGTLYIISSQDGNVTVTPTIEEVVKTNGEDVSAALADADLSDRVQVVSGNSGEEEGSVSRRPTDSATGPVEGTVESETNGSTVAPTLPSGGGDADDTGDRTKVLRRVSTPRNDDTSSVL